MSKSPHILGTALKVAVVAAVSGGLHAAHAQTPDPLAQQKTVTGKEKCYGVAKAGENGCQAVGGTHTCGGGSSADYRGENWEWVPTGTCLNMGGQLQAFEGYSTLATKAPIPKKP